jgi:hypothetical protein
VNLNQLFVAILLLFAMPAFTSEVLSEKEVIHKTAEKAEKNEELARNFGFQLETIIKKMDVDGKLQEEIKRDSHIIWIAGKPYNELLRINGEKLDSKHKAEESRRKSQFLKTIREKKKTLRESLTWNDLFQKYEYSFEKPDSEAQYVISFKPIDGKLQERNVYEKIFNHLTGKAWIDKDFNFLKTEAWLTESMRFGYGIFGKLDGVHFTYSQREFQNVWLPEAFYLKYKARRFIFNDNQEITTRFYDFYPGPGLNRMEHAGSNHH